MPNDSLPDDKFEVLARKFQDAVDAADFDEAAAAAQEVFTLTEEWFEQNPSLDLELTIAASQCELNGDWAGAEDCYVRILDLPDQQPHVAFRAHGDLSRLYYLLRRSDKALRHAQLASAGARRMDIPMSTSRALQNEASLLLKLDRDEQAEPLIVEAICVLGDDRMYDQTRAGALTLRAWQLLRCGRVAEAESDLDRALCLIQPMAGFKMAAGVKTDLAWYWSIAARLRSASADELGAVDAWRKALELCVQITTLSHAASVYSYFSVTAVQSELAKAMSIIGHEREADEVLAERKAILTRFNIPDHDFDE